MTPPFKISNLSLSLVAQISLLLGKFQGLTLTAPGPKLRKKNHIKTIKSTLAIEGNTFTEEQVTAILENKRIIGPAKEILEVKNTLMMYESLDNFSPTSSKSFLAAHKILMQGLIGSNGRYRNKNIGILKGNAVKHIAPKPDMVPGLMQNLFNWLKKEKTVHPLILSSIVHYEIEFIHPFEDGNGRMGRFWQTLLLSHYDQIFKFIPIESVIEKYQDQYYRALEVCDQAGDSSVFIEFMLQVILDAFRAFDGEVTGIVQSPESRLNKAREHFGSILFSRKEYMELFQNISSSTASRDLKLGVKSKVLAIKSKLNQSRYFYLIKN